jgi:tellurite resistance protein TerC
MDKPWGMWLIFIAIVIALLVFDLGVLNKNDHEINIKESFRLSIFYISIAMLFGVWVWFKLGLEHASNYYTGYLVELSLSLDNIFVMSLIFSFFHIPRRFQHRVLFWGILSVILLRGLMIMLGASLVSHFTWMFYVFGVFLIAIGLKMLIVKEQKPDIAHNPVLRFLKKHWHVTHELHGNRFFIKAAHRQRTNKLVYWMTPLFVALVLIEIADLIFAVDSIPAIFLITTDPYIVYTSNIFAVLGLRSFYFALDALMYRFIYLQYALGLVLIFIGSKVFITDLLGLEKFPSLLSLGITVGLLAGGIVFSIIKTRNKQ